MSDYVVNFLSVSNVCRELRILRNIIEFAT